MQNYKERRRLGKELLLLLIFNNKKYTMVHNIVELSM